MSRKRKEPRPYIMRGSPRPTVARPTVMDPPDKRLPDNPIPRMTPAQLRGVESEYTTDPRLRAVERFFMRWAVTRGDGEHAPALARSAPLHLSSHDRPAPLDDAESRIVDLTVRTAPSWAKEFVKLWYRRALSIEEMQENLAIKRRAGVYEERRIVLAYFLGRLIGAGLSVTSRRDVGDP